MHFSINAHAVQGFSLKQVRACLRLEPLSLKLNGSRCGLAYGLPCGLLYVLLYGEAQLYFGVTLLAPHYPSSI